MSTKPSSPLFLGRLEIMAVFSNASTFFIRVCCTSVSHCWYLGPIGLLTSLDHSNLVMSLLLLVKLSSRVYRSG